MNNKDKILLRRRFYKQESPIIEDDILIFTAEQANSTITLAKIGSPATINIEYSTNGGHTWKTYTIGNTITLARVGRSVKFKGMNSTFSSSLSNYYKFQITGRIAASGDVTSLLNGVGGDVDLTGKDYCFCNMFYSCASLTTAPSLPSTTLANYCYNLMFTGCTSLTIAPKLPATNLCEFCYGNMFSSCTSLTDAPVLAATTLSIGCYSAMFSGCPNLTTVPSLPATTLAIRCYYSMFERCISLREAPELPATTLVSYCYYYMFNGCTRLKYIKAMFTTTPSTSYTKNWVSNVASSGTFVKNSAATWTTTGVDGIPSGWTVQTASE